MVATRLRGACRRVRLRVKGNRRDLREEARPGEGNRGMGETRQRPQPQKAKAAKETCWRGVRREAADATKGVGKAKGGPAIRGGSQQGRMCVRVTFLLRTFLAMLRACDRMASLPNSSDARKTEGDGAAQCILIGEDIQCPEDLIMQIQCHILLTNNL